MMVKCIYCGKKVRVYQPKGGDGTTVRAETHAASRYPRYMRCQGSHESYEIDQAYGRDNAAR